MIARLALAAALLVSASAARAEKELHWRELDVEATLDAKGALHVRERQVMVFTGDWNGGERRFRLEEGQELRFESLTRLDGPSSARPLVEGDLGAVDHYRFTDAQTLRWRARKADDPPFRGTALTYELRYTLARIVRASDTGEGYYLGHDFAFPDRDGVIERIQVKLTLDPAWTAESGEGPVITYETTDLSPGGGAVLSLVLAHAGAEPPDVWTPPPPPEPAPPFEERFRLPLLCFAAALLVAAFGWLRRDAGLRGLLGPGPGPVTPAFLEQHVWTLPPELVGAAWDGEVGSPEVSATLARMTAEGKLEVQTSSELMGLVKNVRMKLKVPRKELVGHEQALIAGLFPNGDETDSNAIRAHYRSRGFDPSTRISSDLRSKANTMFAREAAGPAPGTSGKPPRWPRLVAGAVAAGAIAAAAMGIIEGEHPLLVLAPAFGALFGGQLIVQLAKLHARAAAGLGRRLAVAGVPLLLWLGHVLWLAWHPYLESAEVEVGRWAVLEGALLWAAAVIAATGAARSTLLAGEVRVRRRLAVARSWLAAELRKPSPALRDDAIPYLLALGLGAGIDRWLRVHAPSVAAGSRLGTSRSSSSDGFSGASGSSGGAWTGGGGAFSGGGASGTWAALGAVSAGVSAPSKSSGSSFSSSSSSSSSGGGGGGGW